MSEKTLMEFWYKYSRASHEDAAALLGGRPAGYTRIAKDLAGYASNLAAAKICRRQGNPVGAVLYSDIAAKIERALMNG